MPKAKKKTQTKAKAPAQKPVKEDLPVTQLSLARIERHLSRIVTCLEMRVRGVVNKNFKARDFK